MCQWIAATGVIFTTQVLLILLLRVRVRAVLGQSRPSLLPGLGGVKERRILGL